MAQLLLNTTETAIFIGIDESKLIGWLRGHEFDGIQPPKPITRTGKTRRFTLVEAEKAKERLEQAKKS